MLIGETAAGPLTWRSTALATLGGMLVLLAVVGVATRDGWGAAASAIVAAAGAFLASVLVARRERRKRAFIANFGTTSLRLDFVTPFAGRARTVVVPFDAVKAVSVLTQGNGETCVAVEFVHDGERLQEVLAANVPAAQFDDAKRLTRVLESAFGLGAVPADSPALQSR